MYFLCIYIVTVPFALGLLVVGHSTAGILDLGTLCRMDTLPRGHSTVTTIRKVTFCRSSLWPYGNFDGGRSVVGKCL